MSWYNSNDFDDIIDNFDNIKLDNINSYDYQYEELKYSSYDNYVLLENLISKIPIKKLIHSDIQTRYIEKLNSEYFKRLLVIHDLPIYEYRCQCRYLKNNYLRVYNTILNLKSI
jgi:hypothetical protein